MDLGGEDDTPKMGEGLAVFSPNEGERQLVRHDEGCGVGVCEAKTVIEESLRSSKAVDLWAKRVSNLKSEPLSPAKWTGALWKGEVWSTL